VRAISLSTALTVAAAAVSLAAAVLTPLAAPSAALAGRWSRPVPGEVARPFDYTRAAPFAGGAHRGADLAAPPGTVVRSACSGRVVHAGAVAGPDLVVSVRCGGRRVSHLPLATVDVRPGTKIDAGTRLGTLAAGHPGLHLGVRREGDRFGYEDPVPLLTPPRALPPAAAPVRRDRPRPAPRPVARPLGPVPAPRPLVRPLRPETAPRPAADGPRPVPRIAAWPATAPRPLAAPPPASLAPWPVWLGLAALLTGAVGSATITGRRRAARRRAPAGPAVQRG
jgi:murein DD-endopeptidase MepM/ murein hydrolase activator NlpD